MMAAVSREQQIQLLTSAIFDHVDHLYKEIWRHLFLKVGAFLSFMFMKIPTFSC